MTINGILEAVQEPLNFQRASHALIPQTKTGVGATGYLQV